MGIAVKIAQSVSSITLPLLFEVIQVFLLFQIGLRTFP
jgi:hypothetical protein